MNLTCSASEIAACIPAREYNRLLGLPRDRPLEGDLLERARGACEWYERYGHPFVATRRFELRDVSGIVITVDDGLEFRSAVLADRLRHGEAHAVVALATTAGTEVADQVSRLWAEGLPDEAFFLDRFAVAVTERLIYWTAAALCRQWDPAKEIMLPHLSPGCGHWDLADQHRLMAALADAESDGNLKIGPVTLLPSGALHPQHSVLAVMGVTRRPGSVTPEQLCRACDFSPCSYRRAPYLGMERRL